MNRISVTNVENLLRQQFSYDFSEKACEENQEMSREDVQFLDSVNETVDGHYSIGLPLSNKAIKMPNNHKMAMQSRRSEKKTCQKERISQRVSELYV